MVRKILVVLLLLISTIGFSQSVDVDVDKYKALFTVNFVKFIGWTEANKKGDFVIGVLKNENIANKITTNTKGKKVGYQDIIVKHFKHIADVEDCQVLYVAVNQYLNVKNITKIKVATCATPTLIITETINGTSVGSMINFVIIDNKLNFEIDIENIESSGLKISSTLKSLNNAIVK